MLVVIVPARAEDIPIIDAHSQIDQNVDLDRVVPLLDQAGIARVILSTRGKIKPFLIADLARRHPGRIVASFRTKGRAYAYNKPGYYKLLDVQLARPEFRAMAEILLWHAAKGQKAPEFKIPADSPASPAALKIAFDRGWPAVLHYEFAAARLESRRPDGGTGRTSPRPPRPSVRPHPYGDSSRPTRRAA